MEGEWRLVTRRRATPNLPAPPQPKPFQPFHTQPSYAEMVSRNSSPPSKTTPNPSKPPSTRTLPKPMAFISPHNSAQLRFPPSPTYTEWRGRCFNCCRMGHNAARCRNPKRCGKCWGEGHIVARCRQAVQPVDASTRQGEQKKGGEPGFEDLLAEPAKSMPEGRPDKVVCFVERDEEYFAELAKLEGAVIMYNPELEVDLELEEVVHYATQSKLVTADEISVGILTRSRYVILLPHGLAPDVFIKAIPMDVWNKGFSFYQWSPLDDGTVMIPHYKVLLDLVGIPMDLYRPKEVIRAMSSIGTYLGTIPQPRQGDIAVWTVVVATTDLARIPLQITYMVGGLEFPVDVLPRTWKHCPLYQPADMAQPKEKFKPVIPVESLPSTSSEESLMQNDKEIFHVSRAVLQELCKGRDLNSLSVEVRQVLAGARLTEITRQHLDEIIQNSHTTCLATQETVVLDTPQEDNGMIPHIDAENQAVLRGVGLDAYMESPGRFEAAATPQTILLRGLITPKRVLKSQLALPTFLEGENSEMVAPENPPRILERGKDKITEIDDGDVSRFSERSTPFFSHGDGCPSVRQKRKKVANSKRAKTGPSRRGKQARAKKTENGLVEVEVTYEHCSRIASGSGFQTDQVQNALKEDNESRAEVKGLKRQDNNVFDDLQQGEHLTDFDPDSDDSLGSDSD